MRKKQKCYKATQAREIIALSLLSTIIAIISTFITFSHIVSAEAATRTSLPIGTVCLPPASMTTYVSVAPLPYMPPQLAKFALNANTLFSLINAYRQALKLPVFQKEDRLCQLATDRAPELEKEIYVTKNLHAGLYSRSLPYWDTENIISMNSEQAALNWWIHDPIHKAAIEGKYIYSCLACSGNNCAEEFSNFQTK